MYKRFLGVAILWTLWSVSALAGGPAFYEIVDAKILRTIPLITTAELASAMSKNAVTVLDAREPREFEVSHLPGANWVGFSDFSIKRVAGLKKSGEIVVYCSIGYRSEKIGEQLKKAGFTRVRNLYGGVFAWANEKHPVWDSKQCITRRVHGYDCEWSRLLNAQVEIVLE